MWIYKIARKRIKIGQKIKNKLLIFFMLKNLVGKNKMYIFVVVKVVAFLFGYINPVCIFFNDFF